MTYYRVGNEDENIFETCSVELATEQHNISEEEIFEMYGVSDSEELEELLDDEMMWMDDGHYGSGIYYNGVCCCDSLESLKSYFSLGSEGLEGSVVFVFEGEWMGSCNDGEVVNPTKIIEILDISMLDKEENES